MKLKNTIKRDETYITIFVAIILININFEINFI